MEIVWAMLLAFYLVIGTRAAIHTHRSIDIKAEEMGLTVPPGFRWGIIVGTALLWPYIVWRHTRGER